MLCVATWLQMLTSDFLELLQKESTVFGPVDTVVSEWIIGTLTMFNSLTNTGKQVGNPDSVNPEYPELIIL